MYFFFNPEALFNSLNRVLFQWSLCFTHILLLQNLLMLQDVRSGTDLMEIRKTFFFNLFQHKAIREKKSYITPKLEKHFKGRKGEITFKYVFYKAK